MSKTSEEYEAIITELKKELEEQKLANDDLDRENDAYCRELTRKTFEYRMKVQDLIIEQRRGIGNLYNAVTADIRDNGSKLNLVERERLRQLEEMAVDYKRIIDSDESRINYLVKIIMHYKGIVGDLEKYKKRYKEIRQKEKQK